MKKITRINYVLALFLLLLVSLAGCISSGSEADAAEPIVFTDMAGREVTLDAPAETVVICNGRFVQEFAAVVGEDFVEHVAGMGYDFRMFDPSTYNVYLSEFPDLADVPEIGHFKDSVDVEMIVSLQPDAVFIQTWWLDTSKEVADNLEAAGIPVVYIDFSDDPVLGPSGSLEIFGKVMGCEQRASEIVLFYMDKVDMVRDRILSATSPAPTVYIEMGTAGPAVYGNTYGNIGWGALVSLSGGDNITGEVLQRMGKVDPEFLLETNPDIIIFTARAAGGDTGDTIVMGHGVSYTDTQSLLEKYVTRPGWDTLDAVHNGNVYGIYHSNSIQMYNFYSMICFAKWFYPEEFGDVDPDEILKDFYDLYSLVDYSGTWSVDIDQ